MPGVATWTFWLPSHVTRDEVVPSKSRPPTISLNTSRTGPSGRFPWLQMVLQPKAIWHIRSIAVFDKDTRPNDVLTFGGCMVDFTHSFVGERASEQVAMRALMVEEQGRPIWSVWTVLTHSSREAGLHGGWNRSWTSKSSSWINFVLRLAK